MDPPLNTPTNTCELFTSDHMVIIFQSKSRVGNVLFVQIVLVAGGGGNTIGTTIYNIGGGRILGRMKDGTPAQILSIQLTIKIPPPDGKKMQSEN